MDNDILKHVELNGAHIEVYPNSVLFFDHQTEDCWEFDWKELFRMTEREAEGNYIAKTPAGEERKCANN